MTDSNIDKIKTYSMEQLLELRYTPQSISLPAVQKLSKSWSLEECHNDEFERFGSHKVVLDYESLFKKHCQLQEKNQDCLKKSMLCPAVEQLFRAYYPTVSDPNPRPFIECESVKEDEKKNKKSAALSPAQKRLVKGIHMLSDLENEILASVRS